MTPLKEMFNERYYKLLAAHLEKLWPALSERKFINAALKDLQGMELNDRLRHTSRLLHFFMEGSFPQQLEVLYALAPLMPKGYTALVYPDFVAQFGLDQPAVSLPALKYFTTFGSSEFGIRFFLRNDFEATLAVMEAWSRDKDPHVRRLASEGSRPRLPWSFKLDAVLQNPSATKRILEILNNDPELYVRKSVANHLNDLSKDHPEYMLSLISDWNMDLPHTAWIVKHATRTLVKKGDAGALRVLSFDASPQVEISELLLPKKIKLGQKLVFSFAIHSLKKKVQRLVIDYRIHYVKSSGKNSAKVFKLKNMDLKGNAREQVQRSQLFKDFSTRTHHPGKHLVEILVNGKVMAQASFLLEK
jgi:3-methyladenine DNA glycosylase AlkC